MDGEITVNIQTSTKASDPLLVNHGNLFKRTKNSASEVLTTSCMFVLLFAIIIIVSAFPITQIILGTLYKDSCPINYLIPIYLIVAGATTLTIFIISILKIIVEDSRFWSIIQAVLVLFCLVWFVMGNIWTFKAKKTVQFYNENIPSTYCDYSVFNCAYGTLFISYGFIVGTNSFSLEGIQVYQCRDCSNVYHEKCRPQ